jgi:hypothetical protein
MMKLKKRHIFLLMIVLIFIIITKQLVMLTQQDYSNSIRPTFNAFNINFLQIIYFFSSFSFCIICIFRYRRPKESNGNNRCIICGVKNKELNDISMCLKCSSSVLVDDNFGFAC